MSRGRQIAGLLEEILERGGSEAKIATRVIERFKLELPPIKDPDNRVLRVYSNSKGDKEYDILVDGKKYERVDWEDNFGRSIIEEYQERVAKNSALER